MHDCDDFANNIMIVEGRHGMLFTTNCLLLLFGFVYLCLGRVRVGFAAGA